MSLNDTPSGERVHIGFFGRRNAGKSSLVNAVTGQELSVVSDVKGTTTDPVRKAMELLPLGPVEIIDTPGFDDEGALGELRVKKTRQILGSTDIAVLAADGTAPLAPADKQLVDLFRERDLPYLIVYTKSDLGSPELTADNQIAVSALTGQGIHELKEKMAAMAPAGEERAFHKGLRTAGIFQNPEIDVVREGAAGVCAETLKNPDQLVAFVDAEAAFSQCVFRRKLIKTQRERLPEKPGKPLRKRCGSGNNPNLGGAEGVAVEKNAVAFGDCETALFDPAAAELRFGV